MASPKFNRERALRIVVDAMTLGPKTACANWKISEKTLARYQKRLKDDPELSEAVREKAKADDLEWGAQRRAFLAEGLKKMRDLVARADSVDHLHAVAGAVKIAGELQIAAEALSDDPNVGAGPHHQDAPHAGDPRRAASQAGSPPAPH